MLVRVATQADLPLLQAGLAAPPGVHESRLQRQAEGHGDFLLVFDDAGTPLGSAFLKTSGPMDPEVASRYPEVVELIHMQVAEAARGRGAGTALLETARLRADEHGSAVIGLSVGADNPRARALYERNGYVDTGTYFTVSYVDGDGTGHTEVNMFMTRPSR